MLPRRTLTFVTLPVLLFFVADAKFIDMKINLGGEAVDGFSAEDEILNLESSETLSKMRFHGNIKRGNPHPNVFKTQRFSRYEDLVLHIPVPDGVYSVSLLFAETWKGAYGPNKRVFDVYLGSQPTGVVKVLSQFDPFREGGAAGGIVKKFTNVATQNGLTIALRPIIQNPQIAGIIIQGFSYSNALIEDLPTVASQLPSGDDFSVLSRIGPRLPADPSLIYDPNANPKFKVNPGSPANKPPPPPPSGTSMGGVDLSLTPQFLASAPSGFSGGYGAPAPLSGKTALMSDFGLAMQGTSGLSTGADLTSFGGYGVHSAPKSGDVRGLSISNYGGPPPPRGHYGPPVYHRRLNSIPEQSEDFFQRNTHSLPQHLEATFSYTGHTQENDYGSQDASNGNVEFQQGLHSQGSIAHQDPTLVTDLKSPSGGVRPEQMKDQGMLHTMGMSGILDGFQSSPNGLRSVPGTVKQLGSSSTQAVSNGDMPIRGEMPASASSVTSADVHTGREELSSNGMQEYKSQETMSLVAHERSEPLEQAISAGQLGKSVTHKGGMLRDSGTVGTEGNGISTLAHDNLREGKFDGTEQLTHPAPLMSKRVSAQRAHQKAQAQSEQLQELRAARNSGFKSSDSPSGDRIQNHNGGIAVASRIIELDSKSRTPEDLSGTNQDGNGFPHNGIGSNSALRARSREDHIETVRDPKPETDLQGGAASSKSQVFDRLENLRRDPTSPGNRIENHNSPIHARHGQQIGPGESLERGMIESRERHDFSGGAADHGLEGPTFPKHHIPLRSKTADGHGSEGSGLEGRSSPPTPGIHNGIAQLEGVCIHNETHCSCGMTDQPADEPCLVVINNNANPMVCAESGCNGHLVCACAAGANTLCKRTRVTSILVAVPDPHQSYTGSTFDSTVVLCRREALERPIEVLIPML